MSGDPFVDGANSAVPHDREPQALPSDHPPVESSTNGQHPVQSRDVGDFADPTFGDDLLETHASVIDLREQVTEPVAPPGNEKWPADLGAAPALADAATVAHAYSQVGVDPQITDIDIQVEPPALVPPSQEQWVAGERHVALETPVETVPGAPGLKRRLHQYFEASCDANPYATAVITEHLEMTYGELDARANQLAHALRSSGIREGCRVAIVLNRSKWTYISLLGVLKSGAAFVPVDPASPADRVEYITSDSNVDLVLSHTELTETTSTLHAPVWRLNELAQILEEQPAERLLLDDSGETSAYIIYTSGSSGRPKGVEVAQSSICNFINVVPPLYNVSATDRVYQGMTIAFDFSIEEIWPTWAVGAAIVAGPNDGRRLGPDLGDFLERFGITVMYCVPTVLATIDRDLPRIHTLNVGGEACAQELVERWGNPNRLILNTYGPTEATVTCIYTKLEPGIPVTIGYPLPTYEAYLLDENLQEVPYGEMGEICIGGPGVAMGYVGRPDLTAEKFIPHTFGGTGKIYRTGDLGRMTQWGIEYMGRADDEVKVRGHRVDLGEIEAQMRLDPAVNDAVVVLVKETGDLAGYLTRANLDETDDEVFARLHSTLRERLPSYMVPAYLTAMDAFPMLPSGKVDRKTLPPPAGHRLVAVSGEVVHAANDVEQAVVAMWSQALKVPEENLSTTADFFTDLGGHSLAAATAVSAARREYPGAALAVADLYANPTVERFSACIAERALGATAGPALMDAAPSSTGRLVGAGLAQALWIYVIALGLALPLAVFYQRTQGQVTSSLMWNLLTWVPITYLAMRWILPFLVIPAVGATLKPGRYRLWGSVHVRVWLLARLLELVPLTNFAGSPMAGFFLRLLGAKVGKDCHIASTNINIPSMLRIGDGASVGYGTHLQQVSVERGWMILAPTSIGEDAFVGSSAMVAAGASVGDRAIVTEHSVLGGDVHVPEGQIWGGSPARADSPVSPMLADILDKGGRSKKRWSFGLGALMLLGLVVLEAVPFLAIAPAVALVWWVLLEYGQVPGFFATVASGPIYVVAVCVVVWLLRRLVSGKTPEGVFPAASLIGLQRWFVDKLLELSLELTNSLYATLYTPTWLRSLGAKIGKGSEISTIAHVDPELLVIEDESFVADMAHIGSAVSYHGYIGMGTTRIGERAFVGNASFVPAGTSLGDGSLIGVQTVPPVDGVPQGTSWLGAPAIFLPQRQESESFDDDQLFRPSKRVIAERLIIEFFRATLPAGLLGAMVYLALLGISLVSRTQPLWQVVLLAPLMLLAGSVATVLIVAAMKWFVIGDYHARVEPLWSRFVRYSELVTGMYEAAAVPALLGMLCGTPMLAPLLRLFGVHVGRRAYIGTTYITEFDMVRVGDDAAIGAGVSLQTHLFEDRVMKISEVNIAHGASVGDRSVVLYDASVDHGAVVGPLSLVMKGETLLAETQWLGIPAAPRKVAEPQ